MLKIALTLVRTGQAGSAPWEEAVSRQTTVEFVLGHSNPLHLTKLEILKEHEKCLLLCPRSRTKTFNRLDTDDRQKHSVTFGKVLY